MSSLPYFVASFSKKFLIFPALGFLFLFSFSITNAATCTDTYLSGSSVPTGYGASYNFFSAAKELLVKTTSCTDTSLSIKAGNSDVNTLVYKEGYHWSGTGWIKYTLTSPDPLEYTSYYPKSATANIPVPAGNTTKYYVAYTCLKVGADWKCGCSNATCATRSWQLQNVKKTEDAAEPTATLTANPTFITASGNSTLTWSSTNTTSCTGTGFSTGSNTSGSVMVSPDISTTYTLNCTGTSGSVTKGATVSVGSMGSADLVVNYETSASEGMLNHVASGFLHGLNGAIGSNKIAPASLYAELAPKWMRSPPMKQYWEEDKRLRGGPSDLTIVSTLSANWGHPKTGAPAPWGRDYDRPDYSAWLNYVVGQVNIWKASGVPASQRIYDFWNEPNGGGFYADWGDPDFTRFKECWALTYRLIKRGLPGYNGGLPLDPEVRVTAPGTAVGLSNLKETFTADFMTYAKNNNVVPDLWNWHFGDPPTHETIKARMDHAYSIGAARDVLITEYLRKFDGQRPGRAIYELAMLESASHPASGKKVIGAMHARWPETDLMGNSLFLSGGVWRKHGMWYVYKNYADMKGSEASFSYGAGKTKFGAVASIDAGTKKAWALVGNNVFDTFYNPDGASPLGTVSIKLGGIKSGNASGSVNVTVSQIPYDNFGEVTDTEIVKVINNVPNLVIGNAVTIAIPWGRNDNGYFIEVTDVLPQ